MSKDQAIQFTLTFRKSWATASPKPGRTNQLAVVLEQANQRWYVVAAPVGQR